MSRYRKIKIVMILVVLLILVFYARTVPQISLTERAIVVGMAIDYDKDNGYNVSMQIINPVSKGGISENDDKFGIASGVGKTTAEAIDTISQKTGLIISLSQCNILILGEGILSQNILPAINFLVQSYGVPEQAVLVATTKQGVDLLKANPTMTNISAFQLQQSLISMRGNSSVVGTDLKDFMAGYLSKTGTSIIDFITIKEIESDNVGGGQGMSSGEKVYDFLYGQSIIFTKQAISKPLSKNDTLAINLLLKKIKSGDLNVVVDDTNYNLLLNKKNYKCDIKIEKGKINYQGTLTVDYTLNDVDRFGEMLAVEKISDDLISSIQNMAKLQLEKIISDTFENCKNQGFDVFSIYDKTLQQEGNKFKMQKSDNYLSLVDFNINAKVKISRK